MLSNSTFAPAILYLNNGDINIFLIIYRSNALWECECVLVHTLNCKVNDIHMSESRIRSLAAKAFKVSNCFLQAMAINFAFCDLFISFLFSFVPVIFLCFPYCNFRGPRDEERSFRVHLFQFNGVFVFQSFSNNLCCNVCLLNSNLCYELILKL